MKITSSCSSGQSASTSDLTLTDASLSDLSIHLARRNLTEFVRRQAKDAETRLGFGWRAAELAPGSYDELRREHKACGITGLPLRVSSLFCERAIYTSPIGNHAMRFWHDTSHVRLGLDFSADDELELACYHLEALRVIGGFNATGIEHKLLHADTAGQTLCSAVLGHFPSDQLRYVLTSIRDGVSAAIEEERERGAEEHRVVRQYRGVRRAVEDQKLVVTQHER